MLLREKIDLFMKLRGLTRKEFGRIVGISENQSLMVVKGKAPLPKHAWKKLVDYAEGEFTLKDFIDEKPEFIDFLKAEPFGSDSDKCVLSFK